ncbi:hypothetical protein AOLI_G00159000 [Acnodon oligacanthus]
MEENKNMMLVTKILEEVHRHGLSKDLAVKNLQSCVIKCCYGANRREHYLPKAKLNKWLDFAPDSRFEIERAHRSTTPFPSEHGPPRRVLVRFLRYPDKEAVLQAAMKKRDENEKNFLQPTVEGRAGRWDKSMNPLLDVVLPGQWRFVVIDETVNYLYGAQVVQYFESWKAVYKILPLPTTEENKNMTLITKILEEVHRRSEPIIAIGGGVCLDIVGLAASLYRRRTPYIRVPTTLLSYIDASIGAKTGVNFCSCKNKLGSYTPPTATFLDRSFIRNLPRRHVSNGMAEMLKMALMKHKGLFELLEREGWNLLDSTFQSSGVTEGRGYTDAATLATKVAIVTMLEELAPNLWEDDLDRLVDFGHLISPELEMTVLPELLHGEAVNIDMAFMLYVARERGFLTEDDVQRIISCMKRLELPVWHQQCSLDLVQKSLSERLKHSGGKMRMPLPTGLGKAEIFNDVDSATLCQAFKKWCEELGTGH